MYLVVVGCDCQVPKYCYATMAPLAVTHKEKATLNIASAIIVAVNLAFAKSNLMAMLQTRWRTSKAAQFGLVSLPLNFWAVVVIHRESQQVCTGLVHVLLIYKWRHDV